MPATRLATLRYQALDACFSDRSRYYYIEDLISAVNHLLSNNDQTPVSRRTIYNDIRDMESNHDWQVLLDEPGKINGRRYYRYLDPHYSIWRNDLDETQLAQLKSMLLMLQQFRGLPQYERMSEMIEQLQDKYNFTLGDTSQIIDFDTNLYVQGLDYLSPLFNAILHQQVLQIEYQPFNKPIKSIIIHPYYIKQYNGRWFLICKDNSYLSIVNLALDRIKSIQVISCPFIPNRETDFEEHFSDVIGVSIPKNAKIETIVLRFSDQQLPYVLSKPIHESQSNSRKEENIITIKVYPNYELIQKILSFGSAVEVLEPKNVRKKLQEEIKKMQNTYNL
ncbi:MAG: WYL domain-containing protein [Paludibacteraceae bacterium]|nr:WYL domain-containing protein [Paludibacteraceae bacterium]